MQIGTPPFRAGPERLGKTGLTGPDDLRRINGECVRLLARLREGLGDYGRKLYVARVVGPKGDAYRPEEAPAEDDAVAYHLVQIGPWDASL